MNKSETTKAKIFDAAKKLFWNYGYSNISLRQIANIAKIDVALIPRYFGSKLGLFKTTLKDAFEWIDTIDINDSNVADIFIKGLLEGMDIKEETTIIKMLIMNASDPIVGNLVRNTHQKKCGILF